MHVPRIRLIVSIRIQSNAVDPSDVCLRSTEYIARQIFYGLAGFTNIYQN